MTNRILYGVVTVPLAAFAVCGYILWRWGSTGAYGVVILVEVPAVVGLLLRLRNDSKSWRLSSTLIPSANPIYPRARYLEDKIGVAQHDLYVANPALMGKKHAVGALTTGIRRHAIFFSGYFFEALTREEQDAIIAHELAHTKRSHGLVRVLASIGFFFAGLNLFFFSAIPNLEASNLSTFWTNGIASAGIILFIVGILVVRPYLSARNEIEADEITVNALGTGDSLMSSLKKLAESPEIKGTRKRCRLAHQSLYDRLARIQTLSRSLAAQNLQHKDAT